jgi:predicted signal transduction protein with EAL and GGDEF domain
MSDSIEQILKKERLIVHFQPIISLSGRTLFGFESLIRSINHDGSMIAPIQLFEMARNNGVTLELDKLARALAIKAFEPLWKSDNRLILFVNCEPKLIEQFEAGNPLFYGELQKLGIPYKNIVLEVKEDEIENTEKLKEFCDYYRNMGFNIAIQVEQQFYTLIEEIENIKEWWQTSQILLDKHPSIEALYLIDQNNKQVGSTLIKTHTRALYEPTTDGYDCSLKEYHIRVKKTIHGKHLTRPYLSMASGSLCRTHSSSVSIQGMNYVLCIDFIV